MEWYDAIEGKTMKSVLSSKTFWVATAERAVSTFAQAAIGFLTVGTVTGVLSVAWVPLLSAAGLAALVSALKSVVLGLSTGSPAVGSQEVLGDQVLVQSQETTGQPVAGEGSVLPEGTPVATDPDVVTGEENYGLDNEDDPMIGAWDSEGGADANAFVGRG